MAHNVAKLLKVLERYGEPGQVQVVYEAGPTGYGLQRALARQGYLCQVIAPSLIPKQLSVNAITPGAQASRDVTYLSRRLARLDAHSGGD